MRIKSIRVRNFKSFKDCTINFNDFNVVIGSNASGKSNLVQIFKFLKDIQEYGLENAISLQGGVEYFTNNQIGASEYFSLEIVFVYDESFVREINNKSELVALIEDVTYKFSLKFDLSTIDQYKIEQDKLIYQIKLGEKTNNNKIINNKKKFFALEFYRKNNVITHSKKLLDNSFERIMKESSDSLLTWILTNKSLSSVNKKPLKIGLDLTNELLLTKNSIDYNKLMPKVFDYNFNNVGIFDFDPKLPKKATPITGKIDLEEDGSNLAILLNKILRDPEKQRQLSNLVTDLLPFIDTLTVEKFADKSLMFKLKETYAKNNEYLPAAFISDGTINIVALIVALYFSNTSFTIIEEPERNLHPSLISKVVEMMKDASKQKQTLVTTHNPEMIKYADLEDILLISRDEDGFSQITRPADNEQVKIFLENEIGMDELYIQNLLR